MTHGYGNGSAEFFHRGGLADLTPGLDTALVLRTARTRHLGGRCGPGPVSSRQGLVGGSWSHAFSLPCGCSSNGGGMNSAGGPAWHLPRGDAARGMARGVARDMGGGLNAAACHQRPSA